MIEQQLKMYEIDQELGTAFRTDFITSINFKVFTIYTNHLDILRDNILRENKAFTAGTNLWIRYKGEPFRPPDDPTVRLYRGIVELDVSLHIRMDDYLIKKGHTVLNRDRVITYLRKCLIPCTTVSDLYLMVPESLHKFFPTMVEERRKDFEYTIPLKVAADLHDKHKEVQELILQAMLTNVLLES